MNRRLLVPSLPFLAAWILVASTTGCVDARCTRNAECPVGQVCVTATGTCEAPACTSDDDCGAGRVCEQFACVAGCRADAECADDQRCFANHCVPRDQSCDCATAPAFCGVDLNPLSPSAGDTVCVPGAFGQGAMLFFGSVLCSHCQALLDALEVVQAEVQPSGDAPLIFVQEPTIQVSGEVVEGALSGSTVAVLADDAETGIWAAYAADWYHVVLLDRNGCQARHWGPLAPADVSGRLHDELRADWLQAQQAECTPVAPEAVEPGPDAVEPAPEVVPEVGPEVPADLPPDPGVPDVPGDAALDVPADPADGAAEAVPEPSPEVAEPLPEVAEPLQEVADLASPEAEAWVEPFQLQDLCQVEPGLPTPVGAPVPHFLCKDRNPTSPALGGAVSDITLREQVWIAYFGTCT